MNKPTGVEFVPPGFIEGDQYLLLPLLTNRPSADPLSPIEPQQLLAALKKLKIKKKVADELSIKSSRLPLATIAMKTWETLGQFQL